MNTDTIANENSLSDYPDLFQQYVIRSVALAHAMLEAETSRFLAEDRDRALHLLDFALKLDTAWPATRDLLLLLAPKMEQAGHRDDWLPYLYQGLACSRRQNDRLAGAELQLHIGHLYRLQSRFDLAQQVLTVSAAEFAGLNHSNGQARCWNELGYLSWYQRYLVEAKHFVEAALACLDQVDPERATSLSTLGLIAFNEHRLQDAINYIEEAIQIRTQQGDRRRMAWNLQYLGYILRDQGDYTQATHYYEHAIQVLTELQDWRNCAIAQMELGIVCWLIQQPHRALELYGAAELSFRKTQDSLYVAKILTNKGLGYLTLHEWQQAMQTFTASAALYNKLDDHFGYLNALDGQGLAYGGLGLYAEAITIFESALNQLPQIQDDPSFEILERELVAHLKEAQAKRKNGTNITTD